MATGNSVRAGRERHEGPRAAVHPFGAGDGDVRPRRQPQMAEPPDPGVGGGDLVLRRRVLARHGRERGREPRKGSRIIVSGRLEQRSWETSDGDRRSKVEVVADEIGPSLRWATAQVTKNERKGPGGEPPGPRSTGTGGVFFGRIRLRGRSLLSRKIDLPESTIFLSSSASCVLPVLLVLFTSEGVMRVLLRSDVDGVGRRGDIVEVSGGFARNYLVPTGRAVDAPEGVALQAAAMRRSRDLRDAKDRDAANTVAEVAQRQAGGR